MMQLRLRIISEQRRLLGERSAITFGVDGGTIGRSADNDWILPDPQRYISAHHARITFLEGQFVIEDTSTNGVFVNDDERPLRELGPYRLVSGDVLRLGEYQVVAALETQTAETAAATGDAARGTSPGLARYGNTDAVPTHIDVLESFGRPAQTDLGAALDLDALLRTESPSGTRLRPVNAYGQAALPPEAAGGSYLPGHAPASRETPAVREVPPARDASSSASAEQAEDEAVARRIERLARAAAKSRESRGAAAPVVLEAQNGVQAFCRGAGIDAARLPSDAHAQQLHLVGQLLREALVGLKDLERAREESRAHFRIELQSDPDDPRPSLVRSTVEELLVELLAQHESRRLDAVQWLREAIQAARTHERASAEALRAAFVEFVGRFDPAELEARFERTLRRGSKATAGAEPKYWQLFIEFYRNLAEMPADRMPPTFIEAFAMAYKHMLETKSETH
jgi:type VI secretion system protein